MGTQTSCKALFVSRCRRLGVLTPPTTSFWIIAIPTMLFVVPAFMWRDIRRLMQMLAQRKTAKQALQVRLLSPPFPPERELRLDTALWGFN
jgi:hypothetical protein